jgi:hypothetical protein
MIAGGPKVNMGVVAVGYLLEIGLAIYLSGVITAVAIFRKPNAIHVCFSLDLVPHFLLSWLLVLLLSKSSLDVLISFSLVGPIS